MIYLDYSATTPVSKHVLKEDRKFHQRSFANSNSLHDLGQLASEEIENATSKIEATLAYDGFDIVYTSGATESNNLALKAIAAQYRPKGNHIITTPFEHGSIVTTLNVLSQQGFEIDVVSIDESGHVDLDDLKSLMSDQTILLTVGLVNSELGVVQDLSAIRACIDQHPQLIFHSDMTQAVGKMTIDFSPVDLASFSGHKIYGFKGIGALLYKEDVRLTPLIHGGKSVSPHRGGTPPTSLIYALGVAVEDAYKNFEKKHQHIHALNHYLRDAFKDNEHIWINSPNDALPHILNISIKGTVAKNVQDYLSNHGIYVSTTSACSSNQPFSRVVLALTDDLKRAESSIRISISHLTSKKECQKLIETLETYHESR